MECVGGAAAAAAPGGGTGTDAAAAAPPAPMHENTHPIQRNGGVAGASRGRRAAHARLRPCHGRQVEYVDVGIGALAVGASEA